MVMNNSENEADIETGSTRGGSGCRNGRMAEIQATLRLMRRLESTEYKMLQADWSSMSFPPPSVSRLQHAVWRVQLVEWMHRVADVVRLGRPTVAVAAYYLDVMISKGMVSSERYQLAALTSIYVAIKLYETRIFTLVDLLGLVRQGITGEQVKDMEREILVVLNYRMHPPTAYCYVQIYLDLVRQLTTTTTATITQQDIVRLELAANYLVQKDIINDHSEFPPSVIAYAAVSTALGEVKHDPSFSPRSSMDDISKSFHTNPLQRSFAATVERMTGIDGNIPQLKDFHADAPELPSKADATGSDTMIEPTAKAHGVESTLLTDSPRHIGYE